MQFDSDMIIEQIIKYFRLIDVGAKANPKVANLAYNAKKKKARDKNIKRLYKIGCLVEKRGDPPSTPKNT